MRTRPRAVLFDLDDTLFDHARATRAALAEAANAEPGLATWSLDELDRRHREALDRWHLRVLARELPLTEARRGRFVELLAAAGLGDAEARAIDVAERYRVAYRRHWHAVAGGQALLQRIAATGARIGIVTNNVPREPEEKLLHCGLTPLVDALIVSAAVGAHKPDPRIFEIALDRLAATPDEAVMVGDAWATDIVGAAAAGIRPVWFNRHGATRGTGHADELRSYKPVEDALRTILGAESG